MVEHLPTPPDTHQRFPFVGILLGVAAVVAAVVGIYFSRSDLSSKLDVAETQAAQLRDELECRGSIAAEVDVARVDNDIAYDSYVLALGDPNRTPEAVTSARQQLLVSRDAMIEVRDRRARTSEICR